MITTRTQRVRDPIHGLIVFERDSKLDQLAWSLINTSEFQRLRRIKQLGVSEFVFPSATHTRFAHSIGVFHLARKLVEVIKREKARPEQQPFRQERAEVAVIAALLHDIGHGPFSHMFEGAIKQSGYEKNHEAWTREIISSKTGGVGTLLEGFRSGFREEVANIFKSDVPADIYAAVVSSSFDADRLDYMRRDRFMTGSGAGAIDYDWLIEHVRIGKISTGLDEDDDGGEVDTFCFDPKALPAAEQFLLSRYTLYEQVYFHKVTRCVEKMLSQMLTRATELIKTNAKAAPKATGLHSSHPLLVYLGKEGQTLENYLALDDACISGSLSAFAKADDPRISSLAQRILNRQLYKTLDMQQVIGSENEDKFADACRRIDNKFASEIRSGAVIKDLGAKVKMYSSINGSEMVHKKIHILDAGKPKQISKVSRMVRALSDSREFTRYYFENESARNNAIAAVAPKTTGRN
jgi:HD superfamily phosphohydrolase